MRLLMAREVPSSAASLRRGTMLLVLISTISAAGVASGAHRPLPPQVLSSAPGMHPFGKGRHTWWGVRMYDATLWIVGPQWSAAVPHALDIEPGRAVPSDTLVKNSSTGEVDDPSFCPAVMSVWLHPQTKHQAVRKSLLGQ